MEIMVQVVEEDKGAKDEERNSNVLYLNGTSETFAELPQGFLTEEIHFPFQWI